MGLPGRIYKQRRWAREGFGHSNGRHPGVPYLGKYSSFRYCLMATEYSFQGALETLMVQTLGYCKVYSLEEMLDGGQHRE